MARFSGIKKALSGGPGQRLKSFTTPLEKPQERARTVSHILPLLEVNLVVSRRGFSGEMVQGEKPYLLGIFDFFV